MTLFFLKKFLTLKAASKSDSKQITQKNRNQI